MIKKGIILAGGTGSRLNPVTKSTNKQLLLVYDKPLIFYPISSLMLAGIRNILIIVNKGSIETFKRLLKNGKHLGLNIQYKEQLRPTGIPEAFTIGKEFIGDDKIALILGVLSIFMQLFLDLSVTIRYAAFVIIGFGLAGVVVTEGIIGILEMFTVFGNILSYSRIMAIGLASVILATVANRLAEASPNIIIGIGVGFFIHLINFVLGVFSPSIHSLRLHYVEFFSKFYKPQGKTFNPFKKLEGT